MAKKKKRSRQGLFSKVTNIMIIAFALQRPIWLAFQRRFTDITKEATFGLSEGKFDWKAGVRMYAPVGGGIALGKLKQYLMKHFPVR